MAGLFISRPYLAHSPASRSHNKKLALHHRACSGSLLARRPPRPTGPEVGIPDRQSRFELHRNSRSNNDLLDFGHSRPLRLPEFFAFLRISSFATTNMQGCAGNAAGSVSVCPPHQGSAAVLKFKSVVTKAGDLMTNW
jgi:hypothetical protein